MSSSRGWDRSVFESSYAALLVILPRDIREHHRQDAEELFRDLWEDARHRRGLPGAVALWVRSVWSLVVCAAAARLGGGPRGTGIAEIGVGRTSGGGHRGPVRPGRRGSVLGDLGQNIRHAARGFVRRPGFAVTAATIVAVGVGATTTIFSVVDTVLLRALPYPAANRLVFFDNGDHSVPDFREWDDGIPAFEILGAAWGRPVDLTGEGEPERLQGARVTEDFFRVMGLTPYVGRLFVHEDHVGAPRTVVLSYGLWMRRWGGDPSVVGTHIVVDGNPLVVAGVAAPGFRPSELLHRGGVDLWLPLDLATPTYQDRGLHVLGVVGRLAPGATIETAQAELDAILARSVEDFPEMYIDRDGVFEGFPLVPLHEATVGQVSSTLLMLLGAVGMMLLIACANVANLMLARGMARARELALRSALGASRSRVVGQLLTESVALALAGGVGGVFLAVAGVRAFRAYNPGGIPRLEDLAVDPRVLAFAFAVSAATGVLFGILPALQSTRRDAGEVLKDGAASVTATRRGRRLRGLLVIAETGMALVLLAGAGLLFRSFTERLAVDPGFRTDRLVTMSLTLGTTYEQEERTAFVRDLVERVRAIPGVRSAAAGVAMPFERSGNRRCCWRTPVRPLGEPESPEDLRSLIHPVTDGYFATLGARLAYGREFTPAEATADPSVAIVNLVTAQRLFGTENVVDRQIEFRGGPLTVVGVVEGVHQFGFDQDVEYAVYVPHERFAGIFREMGLAVRTDADPATLVPALREAVWSLQPEQPIGEIAGMDQLVSRSVATPRFLSLLLGAFAGVALLLACAGVYSSMLYSVGQRRRELGIRVALGADRSRVTRMVLGQGMKLTLAGVALGLLGSLALTRVLKSLVWGVSATDPTTFVAVAAVLSAVAMTASWAPARRAARSDPLESLRAD